MEYKARNDSKKGKYCCNAEKLTEIDKSVILKQAEPVTVDNF